MSIEQEKMAINSLLSKKKLMQDLFFSTSLSLEAPLEAHVAWVHEHIYSKNYPTNHQPVLPRPYHGIAHVTRAAIYARVWLNLYRKYGDPQALALSETDAKLIQLALLFHDAARENDGVDLWDHESALLLYYYLVHTLNLPAEHARMLAEAVANKDSTTTYLALIPQEGGNVTWVPQNEAPPKSIYQKIIHDADCLDIIRARDHFEADYLDFYQNIAQHNPIAMQDMAELITEARSLIDVQGDSRFRFNRTLKQRYDNPDCYQHTLACLERKEYNPYLVINTLYPHPLSKPLKPETPEVNIPAYDPDRPLDADNLSAVMRKGTILARSVESPSVQVPSPHKYQETFAQLEIQKLTRRSGQPTRISKPQNIHKHGNPWRSTSLVTYGSGVYSSAGYLVINPSTETISRCFAVDADTGRGNNKGCYPEIPLAEKKSQLNALRVQSMKGGKSRSTLDAANHNEVILSSMTQVNAIYYTTDPTYKQPSKSFYSAILQAVYLQQVYKEKTGIELPMINYSWVHHTLIPEEKLTEQQLLEYWITMCQEWIEDSIKNNQFLNIIDINEVKTRSMYDGVRDVFKSSEQFSLHADAYYSDDNIN